MVLVKQWMRARSSVPVLPEIGSTLFGMQNEKQRLRVERFGDAVAHEPSVHRLNDIYTSGAFGLAVSAGQVQ
ncbi:MAG: hypothetical protein QE284_13740 [Rhizobium sp.]|nr:hypothetical protein [Rhizobium sp.]